MTNQLGLLDLPVAPKTLYPFQAKVVGEVHQAIAAGKKSITLGAATGSGKTVMGSQLKKDFLAHGLRVLFVVHRDVLVGQTLETLRSFGIVAGVIAGGYQENRFAHVQVGSVQTLVRRKIDWFKWDVVIFDEAHITAWGTWGQRTLAALRGSDRIAIHLTATPFRLSKKQSFSQISDCLVKAPSTLELMEMGRLSKARYLVAKEVNTEKVKIQKGDYSLAELTVLCDNDEVTHNAYKAVTTHGKGRLSLAFCVGVSHAKRVAAMGKEYGIRAAHVDGTMSRGKRKELYDALANRQLDLLASCEALAEGFDVPNVDCVLLLRPTKSKAKYIQQVGRGLRYFEGKDDCLILCQSGNVRCFGFVEDIEIEFEKLGEAEPAPAPMKVCGQWNEDFGDWVDGIGCGSMIHAPLMVCPHCGYEFPNKDDEKIKYVGEFEELVPTWQKGYFDHYCHLLDRCLDQGWHPYKAIAEYRTFHPKNYYPTKKWDLLWVKDRELSNDVVEQWLLGVERRKGASVVREWLPRFIEESELKMHQI